ncbi:hypothetical protein CRG98_023317, partial [Punica granatum]
GGEPDLTSAAKMMLHDWQRGRIPFFVPPSQRETEASEGPSKAHKDADKYEAFGTRQAAASFRVIASVISSQQQKSIPVQRDLFTEDELKGKSDPELGSPEDESAEEPPAEEEDDS